MNKILLKKLTLCLAVVVITAKLSSQVSGTVFRDYNGNGTQQTSSPTIEPGVAGIVVNAYSSSDALLATQTTGTSGTYTFPASGLNSIASGTAVRLEFVVPSNVCGLNPGIDFPSKSSLGYTNVTFVTGGSGTTNINFPINDPDQYINTTNPTVYVARLINGDPTASGTSASSYSMHSFAYNNSGTSPAPTNAVLNSAIGTTWGLAYSKASSKLFSAAVVRRHKGFASNTANAQGQIFIINTSTNAASAFYNLDDNGFATEASSGALNVPTNSGRSLSATANDFAQEDNSVYAQIAKTGLGDIEITQDGKYLFVMNLYDQKVYRLTLNDANNPTSVTAVSSIALPAVSGIGSISVIRPWALKSYRGKIYVGAVSSGELRSPRLTDNSGTSNIYEAANDLNAYVWELDPAALTWTSTTPLTTFLLNFNRGTVSAFTTITEATDNFNAWTDDFSLISTPSGGHIVYPQPILSDIEFDERGNMILGFMDRSVMMSSWSKRNDPGTSGEGLTMTMSGGDLLRVVRSGSSSCTYTVESNGSGGTGAANGQGPGGGEFFGDDFYTGMHQEKANGGLTVLPGSNQVMSTIYDFNNYDQMAVAKMNTTNGNEDDGYQIEYTGNPGSTGTESKGAGLGDLEMILANPPIEIGNRVWNDTDGDGIQEPGEAGIANVTLEIFADFNNDGSPDGVSLGNATTNGSGEYYFNASNIADGDPNTSGAQPGLKAESRYLIRIASSDWNSSTGLGVNDLNGLALTLSNVTGSGQADWSDNDAALTTTPGVTVPQIPVLIGTAGQNNYNLDFGFDAPPSVGSLGDKVWRDDDKDGAQDAGEPGVAGIAVELFKDYNNDGDFADAGESTPFATTYTDAYGKYLFPNLDATNYQVKFNLPSNYTFTTQTNTTDNTAGTQPLATGSDANATTGRTYTIALAGGENEMNIDAGIIFNTPAATASVGDRVWLDNNSDGTQSSGEAGVSGIVVSLYDGSGNVVATTMTDASGEYLFTDVTPGSNYRVGFSLPPGMVFTTKSGTITGTTNSDANTTAGVNFGKSDAFNVLSGDNIRYVDAGIVPQNASNVSLGDFVWEDIDRDGVQDAGEPGIANVTVNLLDAAGTVIGTTTTNALGYYTFNNLPPNVKYEVQFVAPVGYTISPSNVGSNDAKDSDADPTTGKSGQHLVATGARIPTLDAGMYKTTPAGSTASLGDYVWFDYNRDGDQDNTEFGVAGVTVQLLNSSGTVIGTTVTDNNGLYKFVNLAPGTYSVRFTNIPDGFTLTGKDLGGNNAQDSDADPATGRSESVTLAAGDNYIDLDAGLIQGTASGKGSLGNYVWYDLNNDGLQGANESGVPNVTATLKTAGPDGIQGNGDDVTIGSTTTNALGQYIFTGLDANKYYVEFTSLPTGYAASSQNTGIDDNIDSDGGVISSGKSTTGLYSLAQGEDNMSVDLGLFKANVNRIGNYVWYDSNSDGMQTTGEEGVPGVMVTLLTSAGLPYDSDLITAGVQPITTITNDNGFYQFVDLPDGSYAVQFSNLPTGFTFTSANVGGNDELDSDPNTTSGITAAVTVNGTTPVATPRSDMSLDAGIVSSKAALGNFVWEDKDGDGLQDAGEPGIAGVTVTLYDATGTNALATAITDQNGKYLFPNLDPGTYVVGFTTIPNNMEFTTRDASAENLGTDSDVDPATGKTATVTLVANEVNLKIDAGVRQPQTAAVGNFVWNDLNSNGIQDPGEEPVSGVIATLYNSGGTPIGSAVTDGNGYYLISNVPPGTGYYVTFTSTPTGNFTSQGAGGSSSATNDSKSNTLGTTIPFSLTAGGLVLNIDAGLINLIPLNNSLMYFNCSKSSSSVISLNWAVSDETGVAKYEILKYMGTAWVVIAEIPAKQQSALNIYQFTDTRLVEGSNAYKLVQVYTNGVQFNLSACKSNSISINNFVEVYPNPSSTAVTISMNLNEDQVVNYEIVNELGQVMVRNSKTVQQGNNRILLDVSTYTSGLYFVRVNTNQGQQVLKMFKY